MADYFNDRRYRAELIGTASLVLIGCGATTIGNFPQDLPIGILPIALAFGLTVMAMAYAIGPVSGCHINPAVTAAMWAAGRMKRQDVIPYVVAQLIGGIIGAGILVLILNGKIAGYDGGSGLGQTGWGAGYGGGFDLPAAILTEFLATFLFALVILAATGEKGEPQVAGLVIGLTLVVLHFPFINVTGLSVNPARSLGPAMFVGGTALAQVWMFLVVPTLGGLTAGWVVKSKTFDV